MHSRALIAALVACSWSTCLATAQQSVLAGRVLQSTGTPAARAEVQLRWRSAPELPGLCGCTLDDAGQGALRAQADERGQFRIELPHRGPFELVAAAGGHRSTPQFPVLAGAYLELHLAPPVVVAGTLVDADGKPLPKVTVSYVPEQTAWSKLAAYRYLETRGRTTTDAAGHFELPFHDAYARHRRFESFSVLDFDVPGLFVRKNELLRPTQHCRELQIQLVPAAQAHPRAPRLHPLPSVPTTSPPTVRARLRHSGTPLADAPVLWSELVTDGPPREWQTQTDADGTAVLAQAHADHVVLGFVRSGGRWLPFLRQRLAAGDVDLGTIDVVAHAVQGQVVDASGQPVAGARIAVLPKVTLDHEPPNVTYSDHGGRFAFDALPAGPLRIWADCGVHGFAQAALPADSTEVSLRTPAEAAITGEVVDSVGNPFASAWLVLVRQGKDAELMPGLSEGSTLLCVHSDAEGRVRVTGLPEGHWQVIGNAVRDGLLFGGGSGPIPSGSDFRLVLKRIPE